MKIIHLPLKKEWYEMIEAGIKKEEYREDTHYWRIRLLSKVFEEDDAQSLTVYLFKSYDAVCFSYGYTKRRMMFECKGITIGQGRPEWGAPNHETFIIKLGERL